MKGTLTYPNPFGSGLRRICSNAAPLSVSCASATVVSNPAIPNVRFKPCWIRATALSMALPAVDVSSGRNGEPVCPAPYTAPCSASRTPRQRAEHVLLEPRHDGDVAAAHRISRERGPELQASRLGELVVPGHDARVERHAQDATGGDVGALDRLRSEHGPAREGGADEEEDNAQGSHQQNGTRRMADAVFATPRHASGSRSGDRRDCCVVMHVDRIPQDLCKQPLGR